MEQAHDQAASQWHIGAAVATWLVPGSGHIIIGERRRGLVLLAVVASLWLGGTLVGGLGVFDAREHPVWSLLVQPMVGESCAANWLVRSTVPMQAAGERDADGLTYEPSFARVNEQGVLFTGLAGFLNLLAMIDVIFREPREARAERDTQPSVWLRRGWLLAAIAPPAVLLVAIVWTMVAGYTPFLQPVPIDAYWLWLMLPLVVAVSIVYKAIKVDDLADLIPQSARLSVQIVLFFALAAAAIWGLTAIA